MSPAAANTAGGDVQQANSFDTTTVADGSHTITAELDLDGGGVEVMEAVFTVANGSAALSFSPTSASFTAVGLGPSAQMVDLAASDSSSASFTASADRTWVGVSPASGSTPETLAVSVDGAGLAPGTYSATVTAEAGGYATGTLAITLTITASDPDASPYELVVSSTSDRADPVPLAGGTVSADVYVFLSPP